MFGDCGHGTIMALFALWLVVNEKKLMNFKRGGEVRMTFHNHKSSFEGLLTGLLQIYYANFMFLCLVMVCKYTLRHYSKAKANHFLKTQT